MLVYILITCAIAYLLDFKSHLLTVQGNDTIRLIAKKDS